MSDESTYTYSNIIEYVKTFDKDLSRSLMDKQLSVARCGPMNINFQNYLGICFCNNRADTLYECLSDPNSFGYKDIDFVTKCANCSSKYVLDLEKTELLAYRLRKKQLDDTKDLSYEIAYDLLLKRLSSGKPTEKVFVLDKVN